MTIREPGEGSAIAEAERTWSVASAKSHFSELIERARRFGPQTITRHGRPTAVVVAPQDWERKAQRAGSLVDFFARSPLRGASDLNVERLDDFPRAPEL